MTDTLTELPRLHITPSPRHGVTQYAQRLADALRPSLLHERPERTHVHFTDRLWGADPAAAAAAFERLALTTGVTVTLHDLPQPSDGARNLERRAAAYARVVAAAAGVVCNSRHEAGLLRRYTGATAEVTVIPLPVDPQPVGRGVRFAGRAAAWPAAWSARGGAARSARGARGGAARATVGVLGFVYPGKGHARVISAVAALDARSRPAVEALGRASDGHEGDLEVLAAKAAARGVDWRVTGYLSERALLARSRRTAVPVIAHEHVSASGSLASWLGAGRRPIVLTSPYMEEMDARHPGALTLVDPRRLPEALERALRHPELTWLEPGVPLGATTAMTAERYREFWAGVAW